MNWVALQAPGKVTMRRYSLVFASSALCFFLGSLSTSAQDAKGASAAQSDPWYSPKRYNPVKLFKRGPKSANDQYFPLEIEILRKPIRVDQRSEEHTSELQSHLNIVCR